MLDAFHQGGWGMYPTLFFGALSIAAAAAYARSPDARRLKLSMLLSVVTMLAGLLGFTTGLMTTLGASDGLPNQIELIAAGTFESLNNVALALILLVFSGLVTAVGVWRSGSTGGKAATSATGAVSSA